MQRSHTALAAALVGVVGLVAIVQVTGGDGDAGGDPVVEAAEP